MSEMVERAVRAITEEFESGRRVFNDGEAEALVRVVMETMREPTEEMIKAAGIVSFGTDNRPYIIRDWNAMIDEALK